MRWNMLLVYKATRIGPVLQEWFAVARSEGIGHYHCRRISHMRMRSTAALQTSIQYLSGPGSLLDGGHSEIDTWT
jgi:hypothetical protein